MNWVENIKNYEKRISSQSFEDGVIKYIFDNIGTTNKFSVEFGENGRGKNSNTYNLMKNHQWNCLFLCDKPINDSSRKAFITVNNINDVFTNYKVPKNLDLLSIDIDGNDYWVWKALNTTLFNPKVVIIEFNCLFPNNESKTIEYNPFHRFDQTSYFGASLLALKKLGKSKKYSLIYTTAFYNAFFILSSLLEEKYRDIPIDKIYSYPFDILSYCKKEKIPLPSWYNNQKFDNRSWINV